MGVPGFLFGLACGSVLLAWLYESAACSVLVAAAWHGTYDLTVATAGGSGLVAAVVSTGVMALAVAVVLHDRAVRRAAPARSLEPAALG